VRVDICDERGDSVLMSCNGVARADTLHFCFEKQNSK
jgi:hypothetical protein